MSEWISVMLPGAEARYQRNRRVTVKGLLPTRTRSFEPTSDYASSSESAVWLDENANPRPKRPCGTPGCDREWAVPQRYTFQHLQDFLYTLSR